MRKYIFSLFQWGIAIFLAVMLIAMVSINVSLALTRSKMIKAVNQQIPYALSYQRVFYIFPNVFIFQNVIFSENSEELDEKPLIRAWMVGKIALSGLLPTREFSISEIAIIRPATNYFKFCAFLRDNGDEILEILSKLPIQDIKFEVLWAKMDLAQTKESPGHITLGVVFHLKGDAVSGNVMIRQDKYHREVDQKGKHRSVYLGLPLALNYECHIQGKKLLFDMLTLERQNIYSKLWGKFDHGLLQLNGFAFLNTIAKEKEFQDPRIIDSMKWVKSFLSGIKKHKDRKDLMEKGIYILDIDSRIKFDFPLIDVRKLNFSLNNAPVSTSGSISFEDPVRVSYKASFYSPRTALERKDYFRKADLVLTGRLQNNAFTSEGSLDLDFTKRPHKRGSMEHLAINFSELGLSLDEYSLLRVVLGKGSVACQRQDSRSEIEVKDFKAAFNLQMERFTFAEVYSPFYGGFVHGRVWVDTDQTPLQILVRAKMRDVEAGKLGGLAECFSKVEGKMYGKLNFVTYPSPKLSGTITIQNGKLKDLDFFHWLADTFILPSVRTVNFEKGTADVFVAVHETGVNNIRIKSQDVKVNGDFSIKEGNLIGSKLRLSLSRDLLQQSAKFRPFLRQLDRGISFLDFDFQLSGYMDTVNFQWLDTDIKRQVQSMIPDFIERKIDRAVDKALEPAQKKK